MRILITGCAGFVGSHLADYFITRGDSVLGLDSIPWDEHNYLWQHRHNHAFHYFADSVLNEGLMRYLIHEADAVYHLAAAVGLQKVIGQVLNVIKINVGGTELVLRIAAEFKKRVLFTSTSEIAGKSDRLPFRETDNRVLGPTTVDRWVYSETKALGEYIALGYHSSVGLPVTIVRLFNAYGPRLDREGSGRVITRFMRQAIENRPITIIGDGKQTRCFTYITDIVRGIVAAGEEPQAVGGIFNLGSEIEISINDLVDLVARISGREVKRQYVRLSDVYGPGYEDIPRRVPDMMNTRSWLGFVAQVPLESGMRETFDWLLSTMQRAEAGVYS